MAEQTNGKSYEQAMRAHQLYGDPEPEVPPPEVPEVLTPEQNTEQKYVAIVEGLLYDSLSVIATAKGLNPVVEGDLETMLREERTAVVIEEIRELTALYVMDSCVEGDLEGRFMLPVYKRDFLESEYLAPAYAVIPKRITAN